MFTKMNVKEEICMLKYHFGIRTGFIKIKKPLDNLDIESKD
jgi:hypothetical protein